MHKPRHIRLLPSAVYSSPPAWNLQCKSIPKLTLYLKFGLETDIIRIENFSGKVIMNAPVTLVWLLHVYTTLHPSNRKSSQALATHWWTIHVGDAILEGSPKLTMLTYKVSQQGRGTPLYCGYIPSLCCMCVLWHKLHCMQAGTVKECTRMSTHTQSLWQPPKRVLIVQLNNMTIQMCKHSVHFVSSWSNYAHRTKTDRFSFVWSP